MFQFYSALFQHIALHATLLTLPPSPCPPPHSNTMYLIRMEDSSSRLDHLPTLSPTKTYELSLLLKSPFSWRSGRCRHCCSDFCFSVPAISKMTTMTVSYFQIGAGLYAVGRPVRKRNDEDGQIGTIQSLPLERGALFNRFFGEPAHGPPHVAGEGF